MFTILTPVIMSPFHPGDNTIQAMGMDKGEIKDFFAGGKTTYEKTPSKSKNTFTNSMA